MLKEVYEDGESKGKIKEKAEAVLELLDGISFLSADTKIWGYPKGANRPFWHMTLHGKV